MSNEGMKGVFDGRGRSVEPVGVSRKKVLEAIGRGTNPVGLVGNWSRDAIGSWTKFVVGGAIVRRELISKPGRVVVTGGLVSMDSSSNGTAVVDSVEESGNGKLSLDDGSAEVCGVNVVVVFCLNRPGPLRLRLDCRLCRTDNTVPTSWFILTLTDVEG